MRVSGMVTATWLLSSHVSQTPVAPRKYTHSYSQTYWDLAGDIIHLSGSAEVNVGHYHLDRSTMKTKTWPTEKKKRKRKKNPLILKSKSWLFSEHTFVKLTTRESLSWDGSLHAHCTWGLLPLRQAQSTALSATLPPAPLPAQFKAVYTMALLALI